MATIDDILKHKELLEKKKAEKDAAIGALDTLKQQLKEEYDCDTLEEAGDLLTTIRISLAEDEEKLKKAIDDWQIKYGSLVGTA